jgi:hypothetical protein
VTEEAEIRKTIADLTDVLGLRKMITELADARG